MSLRCLTLVAICVVFISTEAVSGEDVKKSLGDEVSFRPNKVVPSISSITWKQINGVNVVKVIEWDEDGVSIPNPRFKGITTLDNKTGEINITNLKVEHSGLYTIDINSKEQQLGFSLTVMGEDVKKAAGETVSFHPPKLESPVTSITWKQINGGTVKAIEWDEDGVIIPNPRFKDITTLDEKTGEITITNLKVEHSGIYTIDINSREQQLRFSLEVMERVPKPVITIEKSSNTDAVYLRCGYSETIIWKNSTGHTLKGTKNHTLGEFITVYTTRNPENFYTCTLKNAVNEETSDQVSEGKIFGTGEDVKKAAGETVSFHPPKLESPVTSITWKHINGGTVKAIEWDEDGVIIPNPRFKDITTLDEKTGEITITNLKVEHSGIYTIDINSREQQLRFSLEVMERVPKPVITIEKSSNTDAVYLRCGYSETIIWKNSTGHTLKGTKNHTLGEFITVYTTRNPENFYTCTLRNAVNEETSDQVSEGKIFGTGEDVKKAAGETVSFHPPKLESPVTSITWKQINGGTVKAIEWDEDGVSIPNPRFKGITTLDEKTGQITITNLKVEHSGIYTIDINSKEQQQRFSLTVMERVPKPEITIEKDNNTDAVYLRCGYSETIIWKNSAGHTLKGTKNHTLGEFITVKNTRNTENFYTCTLRNAVSEETSDQVYERDLFKE